MEYEYDYNTDEDQARMEEQTELCNQNPDSNKISDKTQTTDGENVSEPGDYDKNANRLCLSSVLCVVGVRLVAFICYLVKYGMEKVGLQMPEIVHNMVNSLGSLFYIVAFALVIYVRVKYPKNIFGKILMWIYIAIVIVSILIMIATILFVYVMCSSMAEGCRGMG